MTVVAAIGLVLNVTAALALRERSEGDVNVRAALFHVFGDALGAIAVIAGGIAIAMTHLAWIDPALSLFVAALIVVGVFRLMRDDSDVLLESVPAGLDVDAVEARLRNIAGVCGVTICTCGASPVRRTPCRPTCCSTTGRSAKRRAYCAKSTNV